MNEEEAFLNALRERPDEDTTRLVYADWLEARGDPRGEYLRAHVEAMAAIRRLAALQPSIDPGWTLATTSGLLALLSRLERWLAVDVRTGTLMIGRDGRREILPAEFQRWYRLIDWIMKLPEEASRAVWERLEGLKEAKTVPYVPIGEIISREKGIKESLREALVLKFPEEGPALAAEFEDEINVERLEALHRAAVLAASPDDFRLRISSPS